MQNGHVDNHRPLVLFLVCHNRVHTEVKTMLDKKDREDIAHLMHVIVESEITPKLNLLLEGHQALLSRLYCNIK